MKQTLDVRHTQKLTMTPQLQQAIRLLQMSNIELTQEMHQAHDINPLLELGEETEILYEPDTPEAETPGEALESPESLDETAGLDQLEFDHPGPNTPAFPGWEEMKSYVPIDQRRAATTRLQGFDDPNSTGFSVPEAQPTLRETLASQAIFLFEGESERRIAHHIIQNINEAGYLDVSLDEVQQSLGQRNPVELSEIEDILLALQKLEPTGVAARSPEECLRLQLDAYDRSTPGLQTAYRIVELYITQLANKEFSRLKKLLRVSDDELAQGVALIQQLSPHPGYSIGGTQVDYVVPDILVEKIQGHWYARLNSGSLPRLSINKEYQQIIRQGSEGEFGGLREQLQHARWLLSNIEKRHQTILNVARAIVERQQEFFDSGAEKIRPMTLVDIARPLDIHESTVSRATAGKFLLAPGGTFELKYFFSSQLDSSSGEGVSSLALQEEVRKIVARESSLKPTSDEQISRLLEEKGFNVARRTIAKYRNQLGIPSSSKRKTL